MKAAVGVPALHHNSESSLQTCPVAMLQTSHQILLSRGFKTRKITKNSLNLCSGHDSGLPELLIEVLDSNK